MDPAWVSAGVAIVAVVISLLALVFGRSDKGQTAARDYDRRIHEIELNSERHARHVAEHYATKPELREAVDDIKNSMNGRFDRLETKLEKERETS